MNESDWQKYGKKSLEKFRKEFKKSRLRRKVETLGWNLRYLFCTLPKTLPRRKKRLKITEEIKAKIRGLKKQSLNNREIALKTGIPLSTVQYHLSPSAVKRNRLDYLKRYRKRNREKILTQKKKHYEKRSLWLKKLSFRRRTMVKCTHCGRKWRLLRDSLPLCCPYCHIYLCNHLPRKRVLGVFLPIRCRGRLE